MPVITYENQKLCLGLLWLLFFCNPAGSDDSKTSCLLCHGAIDIFQAGHVSAYQPDPPHDGSDRHCRVCHGESTAHFKVSGKKSRALPEMVFDRRRGAEQRNAVCLSCHKKTVAHDWLGSVHQLEQIACNDCHRIHSSNRSAAIGDRQSAMCFTCHKRQQAEVLRRSAHPLVEGGLSCMDCHAPHGSSGPALLRKATLNENCYECHAEKRGPFLWEHAPVRENCMHCHVAHGANHPYLLRSRTPWLCQQCHLARFHPSTALSGSDIPPAGASQLLLSRNCMNCHAQIHGSNHPSGAGLTR